MIHNDIQNQLQLLIKTSGPPLLEVADSATETPQWTPGQRLPAYVLASLPNGRFEVKVGDQILDLNLPGNTQAGETLELTYVSSSPRMTFALTQDLAKALPTNTPVSISDTAKFIGSLLQKGAESAQAAQTGRAASVVTAAPTDPAQFAHALRQAVSQSGLFYESHQVQWLSGERHLDALLQEPQGRLSPALQQGTLPTANIPQAGREADQKTILDVSQNTALPNVKSAGDSVHPQTAHLVQQQLQALDARQIIWQGQVWPGQDMQWEIEEDASGSGAQDETPASWQTQLSLHLPALGGVQARLAMVNGVFRLDIAAEDVESAERMRAAQQMLSDRFDASGLLLAGLTIRHG